MELIKIAVFCFVIVIVGGLLKSVNNNYVTIISVSAVCLMGVLCIRKFAGIGSWLGQLESLYLNNAPYISLLLKLIGITYLCDFSSQICEEAGFRNLSTQVTLFGKVFICTLAIPYILELFALLEAI